MLMKCHYTSVSLEDLKKPVLTLASAFHRIIETKQDMQVWASWISRVFSTVFIEDNGQPPRERPGVVQRVSGPGSLSTR